MVKRKKKMFTLFFMYCTYAVRKFALIAIETFLEPGDNQNMPPIAHSSIDPD